MRRLAHVFGRLRLPAGACVVIAAALATGFTLLVAGGADHPRIHSAGRSTAVAGRVPIDGPARAPVASALHGARTDRGAERSTVTRSQPSAQARPNGHSRPGSQANDRSVAPHDRILSPHDRSVARRAGVPGADSAPANARPSPATIAGPHARAPQASDSRGSARHNEVLSAGPRPSLVSRRHPSQHYGHPWKPAGSPDPLPDIPSNSSASELTFFCFIARAAPAGCTGTPASVSVTLQDPSIIANGQSTTTATITVKDQGGSLLSGEENSISLAAAPDPSSPNAAVTFGQVTPNADGTYSATITSGTTAGTVGITATDGSVTPNITSSPVQLILKSPSALPAANVSVSSLSPSTIIANGTSTTIATASVTASDGTPVAGDRVQFSAGGQLVGSPCTTDSSGQCSVTITSTTKAGARAITAADISVTPNITSPAVSLTQTAGPAATLALSLGSNSIVADGKSTTTATAAVTDANGNAVANDSVNFTASNGAVTIGPTCTTASNGQCTVTLTSNTTAPGTVTITATDASVSAATNQATLTVASVIGKATSATVSLNPSSIKANGTSTTVVTAQFFDGPNGTGHPINNDGQGTVSFSSVPVGLTFGPAQFIGNGQWQTTITSSTVPGQFTITATYTFNPGPGQPAPVTNNATLTLTQVGLAAPGAASVAVSVNPVAIFADAVSHAFATAQVDDSTGDPVSGDAVQFFVNDQPFGSICLTDSNGQCHVTLASTTVVGIETIYAVDNSANFLKSGNSVVLSFVSPPPPVTTTTPTTTTPTTTTPKPTHPRASGPSASKIKASLAAVLGAKGASIKALLRMGSHRFVYHALTAGKLTIDWWDGPPARKPKLIAAVTVTVGRAKPLTARLRLTSTGRSALEHANRLEVKSSASFKPSDKAPVSRSAMFTLH